MSNVRGYVPPEEMMSIKVMVPAESREKEAIESFGENERSLRLEAYRKLFFTWISPTFVPDGAVLLFGNVVKVWNFVRAMQLLVYATEKAWIVFASSFAT